MIKRTLLYKARQPGQFFDESAYELHVRKALAFMGSYGCRRLELSTVLPDVPTPGARADRPEFYRILEAYFDDMESAYSCFSSPEMRAIQKVANYHDLGMLGLFRRDRPVRLRRGGSPLRGARSAAGSVQGPVVETRQ